MPTGPADSRSAKTLDGSAGTTKTVIGVVRDARYGSLDSSTYGQVYSSYRPFPYSALLIRTATMSDTLRAVLRRAHEVGGGFGVDRATTMEQALSESIGLRIFRGWLFGGFTIAAMAISAVGILGVIAMTTSRRTRELGVRLTLGATRAKLIRLIMIEQILPIVFGLCTGGLVARWTTRFVQSYLYQFTAHDPRLWTIAALAIVATAIIGGIIPAIRASRVDPIHALREE